MTFRLNVILNQESYEIRSDKEAALAKELAKLLTNELLNYKMNLMPDNVKQVTPSVQIRVQSVPKDIELLFM